jgi:hypothetical protein
MNLLYIKFSKTIAPVENFTDERETSRSKSRKSILHAVNPDKSIFVFECNMQLNHNLKKDSRKSESINKRSLRYKYILWDFI